MRTEPQDKGEQAMTESTQIRDAIAAANEAFMAAFRAGDATGLVALYTTTGQLLPPNVDTMASQAAIQAFWQGVMDAGIRSVQLEIAEVEGHGDTAIEVSNYTLCGEDGQVLDQGKYIVVWKRKGEQWKLHRDIFNSSLPAPGQ
jgi:ketosteroid isomerase-like protein